MTLNDTMDALKTYREFVWKNPGKMSFDEAMAYLAQKNIKVPSLNEIKEADLRLKRFAPFFKSVFKDTEPTDGLVESPLTPIPGFQNAIISFLGGRVIGDWSLKADHELPISGSIKARGGVYEIISFAEKLAFDAGMLNETDNYSILNTPDFKSLFARYTILVGSTGNLGLSIGAIGRALGFKVEVHMSKEAKSWKIEKLQSIGATVVLHASDYSVAVAEGRRIAASDPFKYFVDDENSLALFTGYAVAALRLQAQLQAKKIPVDADHPLFVYLPCGVGGAPGGIAYGLKLIFGDHVYIFLAEPTHAPCMLLGMATEKHDKISISDIGITLNTEADGLAVGRPSGFVGSVLAPLIDGIYTVDDDKLFFSLFVMHESENIDLEPSALAGLIGPMKLFYDPEGFNTLIENNLLDVMENAHHISWGTGGSMVPDDIMYEYIKKGALNPVTF